MHGNPTEPLAQRVFPTLKLVPPLVESLVMPFDVEGTPIGSLWIVAGKDHRKFDGEDERNIRTLAQFVRPPGSYGKRGPPPRPPPNPSASELASWQRQSNGCSSK
jgi:hypothetical protein